MASPTRTARLQTEDHRHLWHPFTQQREWEHERPLIIERGRGVYLEDTDGRRYLDGVSSLWVNLHGHRKRELDRALAARSEEHTSELQSRQYLVCRLLLEKKKQNPERNYTTE